MEIAKGSLVRACAGRDKDSLFVAVGVHDGFVYISDGRTRKLEKPKRKNRKHISPLHETIDTTELTNKKLRKFISQYMTRSDLKKTENL